MKGPTHRNSKDSQSVYIFRRSQPTSEMLVAQMAAKKNSFFPESNQKVGLTSHTNGPQVGGLLVEKGILSRTFRRDQRTQIFSTM